MNTLKRLSKKINVSLGQRSLGNKKNISKENQSNNESEQRLIFSLNKSKIPSSSQVLYIWQFLNKREKSIIKICAAVISISLIILGTNFYQHKINTVADHGGSYIENLNGAPQFINPLYSSINNVDGDLTTLIYAGLLKKDANNELIPDLATKFEISEDEKTYTFYLREDIEWHNGGSFNADDVVFTLAAITNNEYKSPLKISFDGVLVEKVDNYVIKFILSEPYAAFLELLTIGILPAEIWQQIPPAAANLTDLNLKPIGTGPYIFKSLTKDSKTGNIRSYELEANKNYHHGKPYIKKLTFKFSPNFNESIRALNEGQVEGMDFLPHALESEIISKNKYTINYLEQPQYSALFFNQSNLGDLSDIRLRQALAYVIDKQAILDSQAPEFASAINGPILPLFSDYYNDEIEKYQHDTTKAKQLLDAAGWRIVEVAEPVETDEEVEEETEPAMEAGTWRQKGDRYLTLTITTVDQPDNIQTAELIKGFWEKLNIKVNLNIVSAAMIQNEVIRPRNYQILLYGLILGSDPDQYPFWHSSQIGTNGLNLANYSNKQVDELLEDGRITNNKEVRQEKYKSFQAIINKELPAIFLYSQKYSYLQPKHIQGFDMTAITIPSDRFNTVANWYIKTKKRISW